MKVTVSDNQSQQEKEIKFPVLMEYIGDGNIIVLFLSEKFGIVVASDCQQVVVGKQVKMLFDDRNYWKPLPNGVKVTLENDL